LATLKCNFNTRLPGYIKSMINRIFGIILLTTISLSCFAQNPGTFKSVAYTGKSLVVNTSAGYITITPFTADVIRVTYEANSNVVVKSYSTIAQPRIVKAKYASTRGDLILQTSALKVVVNKRDLSISFINNGNDTLSKAMNYAKTGDSSTISFKSDGKEAFYGGGSKAIELNKRGQLLQNYNQAHWDYKYGRTDLNIAIPFFISNKPWLWHICR
jgi:oligosaccharide 4-alpha-D-glucosyltransferase